MWLRLCKRGLIGFCHVDGQVLRPHVWSMSIYTWVPYDRCDFMETICSTIVASAIAEIEKNSISAIVDLIVLRSLRSLNFGNHWSQGSHRSLWFRSLRSLRSYRNQAWVDNVSGCSFSMPKGAFDHISTWRKNISVALRCEAVIVSANHCFFGVILVKF